MEIVTDLMDNQLVIYVPVVGVIVFFVLLFTFGFKSPQQPPFDKLTNDDRKQAGKKRKIKEKKVTANGHVSTGESKSEKSPVKDAKRSPAKTIAEQPPQKSKDKKSDINKNADKNKKNEAIKTQVITDESKSKKNLKKVLNEKPVDFDDGDWETVLSKADKKKKEGSIEKKEQSPVKKEKKAKKSETKSVEIEKLVKEVANKELREKEKEVKEEKPVLVVVEVEDKKEKKKEKKPKKENVEKQAPVAVEENTPVVQQQQYEQPIKTPAPSQPVVEPAIIKQEEKENTAVKNVESGVAFDELGDVWTEAKAAKKSKKKARRDN